MYKLLIVDDNDFEREAMEKYINWDILSVRVVCSAANGKEGLEKFLEYKPDIVITDVKMPEMDGVEMASQIRSINPEAKFIFCSGYDDVKLLKEALELRAYNYLIKPVSQEELVDTVKKVVSILIDENLANIERTKMLEQYNSSLHLIQEEYLKSLILTESSRTKGDEVYAKASNLRLKTTGGYRLAAFDIAFNRQMDFFEISCRVQDVLKEIRRIAAGKNVHVLRIDHSRIVAVFHSIKQESECKAVISDFTKGLDQLSDSYDFKYFLGISEIRPHLTDLYELFRQCSFILEKKVEMGYGYALFYDTVHDNSFNRASSTNDLSQIKGTIGEITAAVCNGEDIKSLMERLAGEMQEACGQRIDIMQSVFISMINSISKQLMQLGQNMEEVLGEEMNVYNRILNMKTLPELVKCMNEILQIVSGYYGARKQSKDEYIVKEVLKILHNEYDQPITLNYLSDRVYFSPNYLRIIFKEKMKISIQNYLTNIRMNKAKELLKLGQIRIQEVGEKVGYPNSTYFNIVFKNCVGMTPGEYRSKFLTNHNPDGNE